MVEIVVLYIKCYIACCSYADGALYVDVFLEKCVIKRRPWATYLLLSVNF